MDVTREQLADALQGFYLDVNCQGAIKHGHVIDADAAAGALVAQLSANAAHEQDDVIRALYPLDGHQLHRVLRWLLARFPDPAILPF